MLALSVGQETPIHGGARARAGRGLRRGVHDRSDGEWDVRAGPAANDQCRATAAAAPTACAGPRTGSEAEARAKAEAEPESTARRCETEAGRSRNAEGDARRTALDVRSGGEPSVVHVRTTLRPKTNRRREPQPRGPKSEAEAGAEVAAQHERRAGGACRSHA